jgi:hypothetical protein
VRPSVSNQTLLWLGAISIGFGLLSLVKGSQVAWWAFLWCAFGILAIVLGMDVRRLWRVSDATRVGALVGGILALIIYAVGDGRPALVVSVAVGCVAISAALAAGIRWFDRRIVKQLVRAHRAGKPIEPMAIAAVKTSRRVVFEVAFLLVEWNRFDVLEQLATHSFVPQADSLRRFYLALALHARGRLDEALDLVKSANRRDHGPYVTEEWDQLVAKIQIGKGEAAEVIATFSPRCPVDHAKLATERLLVLTDAHVSVGDLDAARRLLHMLGIQHGRAFVERLAASSRPCAISATKLLAGNDAPYR